MMEVTSIGEIVEKFEFSYTAGAALCKTICPSLKS